MKTLPILILIISITTGQLIKLPLSQVSGMTLLDITTLVLCCFGLIRLKFKLKKPSLSLKGALIFISVATLSLIFTPLHLTFIQFLSSFLYTIRFSAYILLGWEIYSGAYPLLKDKIPQILITSGFSIAVLGLMQFILFPNLSFLAKDGWDPHYFRIVSTFLDPNFIGAFFVLTLILVRKHHITFAIVYLALLLTFSRSSYGMFFISFTTLALILKSFRLQILTVLLFAGLILGFFLYSRLISLPRNIDRDASASFRITTWTQGWQLFEKHPILGIGFNAYRYAIKEYKLGNEQFLTSHGSGSNDASLLFVASTTGIIGLFSYLFFLFSLSGNKLMIPALTGLLFHSIFANSLFFPPILLWIIIASGIPKK